MNKKWLYLIIFLLIPISLFAGEIHGNIEFGTTVIDREVYSKIMVGYNYNIWKINNCFYGGWETWAVFPKQGLIMDKVLYNIYMIGHRIQYKDIYFKTEHECKHTEYSKESTYSTTTFSIGIEW